MSIENRLWSFYIVIMSLQHCRATDTLTKDRPIYLGQTLVSANQLFELGFFSPGDNSSTRYLGIWFTNATATKIIWVANRENPLSVSDTNSSLNIANDGNLRILDGDRNTVWSTSVKLKVNDTNAKLTDIGDFCLNDTVSGSILWESFDYPGDILLPGMKLGTSGNHLLTSWKSVEDPTPGNFVFGLSNERPPQIFAWDGSKPHWRGGPWDGGKFIGIPEQRSGYSEQISLVPENFQGGAYLTINLLNLSEFQWLYLQPDGVCQMIYWDTYENEWYSGWDAPANPCDVYGVCGAFAVCTNDTVSVCECLRGFVPRSNEEWSKRNWTKGCVRKSELLCEKNETDLASGKTNNPDKFQVIRGIKLPDRYHYFPYMDTEECEVWCLSNCSCKAYAFVVGIYCMAWTEDLIDIEQFTFGGENLFLRLSYAELGEETNAATPTPAPAPAPTPTAAAPEEAAPVKIILITITIIGGLLLLGGFILCLYRWKTYKKERINNLDHFNTEEILVSRNTVQEEVLNQDSFELPSFEFKQIIAATDNFSYRNKLGQGGFGPVYKGMLDTGQHIAVKRLSVESGQGIEEFKNEILLISKLQHRNLVKLLGCCIEGKERLLIYEYLTNKSLDTFLFDPKKRLQLDWATRFNIIQGVGRGLVYLHRDSCLRIIHRDLKCSNILLDENLNPKISDFGLARIFQMTQELANTQRIVGTFGYMSPEYAMGGVISEKSDVFSYGVMLLEIISGKRNTESIRREQTYPLGLAWKSWKEGRGKEFMDQSISGDSSYLSKGLRYIHVGLLCVQDLPKDRPTMTEAVYMLSTESDLAEPKEPLFTLQRLSGNSNGQEFNNMCSIYEATISIVEGR